MTCTGRPAGDRRCTDHRHPTVGHRGVDRGAEQVLDPHRDGGALAGVVDGHRAPAGHGHRRGHQPVELVHPVVADEVAQHAAEVDPFEVTPAGGAGQPGGEPLVERRRAGRRRRGRASRRRAPARAKPTRAWSARSASRHRSTASRVARTWSSRAAVVASPGRAGPSADGEHDGPEPALGALAQVVAAVVPAERHGLLDRRRRTASSTSASSRPAASRMRRSSSPGSGRPRRGPSARPGRVEVGDDEERLPDQRVARRAAPPTAPLRRRKRPLAARLGHPVGVGEGEHRAAERQVLGGRARPPGGPSRLPQLAGPPPHQLQRRRGRRRDGSPADRRSAGPARRWSAGSSSGRPRSTSRSSSSAARAQAIGPWPAAGRGRPPCGRAGGAPGGSAIARPASVTRAVGVEGPEVDEQLAGLGQRRGRRRVEERQVVGGGAPQRPARGPARPGRRLDLGRGEGPPVGVLALGPQPVGDARRGAPGPPGPLVGRGPRVRPGVQPGQPAAGVVAGAAHLAAVDHDPHAVDGEAGLGDVGGQHDPATARRRRREGQVLLGAATARRTAAARRPRSGSVPAEGRADPADVGGAGEEHEHVAGVGTRGRRRTDGGDGLGGPVARVRRPPPHLDGMRPPVAGDDRRRRRPSPPRSAATRPVSSVADMASTRRSGRSTARASRVRARARSVWRLRSWISSKTTRPTPASDGSCWRRRVRMPSVTTSIRVAGPTLRSSRVR